MSELEDSPQSALPRTWIDEALRQIAGRLEIGEQRYSELKSMLDNVAIRIATVEDKQVDLDNRLRTLQRLLTEQRHDVTKEESLVHLGIASEYTVLVTQRLLHLAHQLVEENQPDRSLRVAQAVAKLCHLLFRPHPAQTRDVLDSLRLAKDHPLAVGVNHITEAALYLRQQVNQTPDRIIWDFAVQPHSQVHDGQRTWGSCDPSQPVQFVVAPAYRVNGRIFSPQLVYTSIQSVDLGDSAASRSRIRRLLGQ
jgi:hypothetical protein